MYEKLCLLQHVRGAKEANVCSQQDPRKKGKGAIGNVV